MLQIIFSTRLTEMQQYKTTYVSINSGVRILYMKVNKNLGGGQAILVIHKNVSMNITICLTYSLQVSKNSKKTIIMCINITIT